MESWWLRGSQQRLESGLLERGELGREELGMEEGEGSWHWALLPTCWFSPRHTLSSSMR